MVNSFSQRRALVVKQNFSPFSNQLVQTGYANSEQMHQALVESRKQGRPLTDILQGITGKPLPPELLRQYKRQQLFELKILYGIETLDPDLQQIPTDQVSQLINTLISIDVCRRYQLVPLAQLETQPPAVLVAMVEPDNLEALDVLGRILRPKGLSLQRQVITSEDYQQLIAKHLDEQVKQQKQDALEIQPIELGDFGDLEDAPGEIADDLAASLQDAETAPIIGLVNKILAKALQEGVSDIHIEPQEESLRVRFRKDGVLQQAFDPLPKKIIPAVTSRFKIIADLDIAERRLPQDGRIRRVFQGRKIDFRMGTLPSRYGEKIVLRF